MRELSLGAAFIVGGTLLSTAASAQCPNVGADIGCGAIITITGTGASVTQTGQGPYDQSDDTLIGVVNNIPKCTPGQGSQSACGLSIYSIDLTSTQNIFGFDGDGITTYGQPGNPQDSTGYGGPNVFFSNINSAATSGRVNFITPIPPGGTGFFSLENVLSSSSACTTALNNSVQSPTVTSGTRPAISSTFTPRGGFNISQAAQICGFINFDWQQTITNLPNPRPDDSFTAASAPTTPLVTPFNDPPVSGYSYQHPPNAVGIPVYWNLFTAASDPLSLAANITATTLSFFDSPADPCLPGSQSASTTAYADSVCGGAGVRAPAGSTINFTTRLVGIQGLLPGASVVDTGIGFNWTSTFNGTSGGIAVINSAIPVDAGSGSGGLTVTSFNPTTTYSGVGVTGINGSNNVFGPSPLLSAVLPASRSSPVNGTVTAFATMINTGAVPVSGCSIAPVNALPATFVYQTTNPATNAITGTPNTPVNIAGNNTAQSFVIAFTPTAPIAPTEVAFNFACTNVSPAPINIGLNTLLFSASSTPTPDVIALAATAQNDGIVHISGTPNQGAFAVATFNLGSSDTITVAANTGAVSLPVTITICQTNPTTGQCLQSPAANVTTTIGSNATPTFAIFAAASAAVPFDPANNRIFVTFSDSGSNVRGKTSVAVVTQ
jgi:hypothetical protein